MASPDGTTQPGATDPSIAPQPDPLAGQMPSPLTNPTAFQSPVSSALTASLSPVSVAPNMIGDFFDIGGGALVVSDPNLATTNGFGFVSSNTAATIPSAAGIVGRQKISENTSPIPRDRIFFNYSYFDNVPLTDGGVDINRFTPGFEKTFFDQNASIELRVPFASTLDNNIYLGSSPDDNELELGNMHLALKALLYSDGERAVSAGLALNLPTGDDLRVIAPNGRELVIIENESVHIMPFVGFVQAPQFDGFFLHGFVQGDFDANGNDVRLNNGTGLANVGTLNDVNLIYADVGIGYWLFRDRNASHISGFAPTAELHYTRSLNDSDLIVDRSGNVQGATVAIGSNNDRIEILNAVVGATMLCGDNSTLTVGYATPLINDGDTQFDGELRVMFNYYFGAGAGRQYLPY